MAANFTAFGVGRVFERCFCVKWLSSKCVKSHFETISYEANKRLKRDCQRVAFPVPMSRGG
ncbi:hypothetical protein FXE78_11440, partial [Vibrio mimicus]